MRQALSPAEARRHPPGASFAEQQGNPPLAHGRTTVEVSKIILQLYVAGRTPRAERAIAVLRHLCERELAGHPVELTITDVLADPEQAEARKILATPTLIKEQPLPQRRVIGDLSGDPRELLAALNLPPE